MLHAAGLMCLLILFISPSSNFSGNILRGERIGLDGATSADDLRSAGAIRHSCGQPRSAAARFLIGLRPPPVRPRDPKALPPDSAQAH